MSETAMVNFRMDKSLKTDMEKVCKAMGLSATSAYTIFAKKVCLEKRIPFEITADPFYNKENTAYLTRTISDIESGNVKLTEHNLIEE